MAKGTKQLKQNKFDIFIDGQYRNLDKKVKILALAALFIVPIALLYYFQYQPNIEEIQNTKVEIIQMQTAIDKAKAVTRNLQKYKEDLAETQKKFEETAIMLPKTQEIPDLLRNISDLGREAGLEFLEFAPGIEVQQDFYAEIPINIRLLGPYHNIGNFLDKVSKLDRVVTVNNIKIGQAKEDTNEVLLNATCQLVTYRFTGQKLADGKDKKK